MNETIPGNVLITGGARGIGRAIAEKLALKGWKVLINYNTSAKCAAELVAKINSGGGTAYAYQADVSRSDEVEALFSFAEEKLGSITALVNNAGIAESKLFDMITDENWQRMLDVNLNSVFYCSRRAAREMLRRKSGKIINIASIWGEVGAACEVHYSAAKAGVIGLTRALAKELAPSGIRVNCVSPGVIRTGMLEGFTEEELQGLAEEIPLGYIGKTEDIAECVAYLLSPNGDYLTGQVISVNGGFGNL